MALDETAREALEETTTDFDWMWLYKVKQVWKYNANYEKAIVIAEMDAFVAHEILVSAPEAKFPSPLFDLSGTWPLSIKARNIIIYLLMMSLMKWILDSSLCPLGSHLNISFHYWTVW